MVPVGLLGVLNVLVNSFLFTQEAATLKESEVLAAETIKELEQQLEAERARNIGLATQNHLDVLDHPPSPSASVRSNVCRKTGIITTPAPKFSTAASTAQTELLSQLAFLQASNAELASARAAAEAEAQMLMRQLRRAQIATGAGPSGTWGQEGGVSSAGAHSFIPAPSCAAPSLHTVAPSVADDTGSICSYPISARPAHSHNMLAVPLANMSSGGMMASGHASAAALSAKESRISELRKALSSCMAERDALAAKLEEARGPHGQMPSSYHAQLQHEAGEARAAALEAQRKLFECQQQLARAQVRFQDSIPS